MKKFLLSFGLIFSFAGYVVYQRTIGSNSQTSYLTTPTPANNIATSSTDNSYRPASAPVTVFPPSQRPRFIEDDDDSEEGSVPASPPLPAPTPTPVPTQTSASATGAYRNGSYTGSLVDAFYGNVQVKAVITGGKLSDVQFLDYPQDRSHSLSLSNYSLPILRTEAIQAQSANVDAVSGATQTSEGFNASLAFALAQAK